MSKGKEALATRAKVGGSAIAQIAIILPDLRFGGAERVNIYLANEFVKRGFAVDMVLMEAAGELMPLLDSRIRVVELGAARMRNLFVPLSRYIRDTRPVAVLANMWPLTAIAPLAARWAGAGGAKIVLVEHNNWSAQSKKDGPFVGFFRKWSMRLFFPLAAASVGVSKGVARDVERYSGLADGSVRCVYNPVTGLSKQRSTLASSALTDPWRTGNHKKIIAVGIFQAQKRFDRLLNAFSLMAESADARLLLLGDGPERPSLEALIAKLELQDRVSLPGFVDDPSAYCAEADLFVLSSDHEGLPTVLLEALEQGTPVVSTDCPSGPREILEDGKFGKLVPVGDVAALAKAMQEALVCPHDHDALKRRAGDFSVEKAADAYLDLLLPGWRERPAPAGQSVSHSQRMPSP